MALICWRFSSDVLCLLLVMASALRPVQSFSAPLAMLAGCRWGFAAKDLPTTRALTPPGQPARILILRGGSAGGPTTSAWSSSRVMSRSLSMVAAGGGEGSPTKRIRGPKFLVDQAADGSEISRRPKPPGRTPAGYVDQGNGEWIKVVGDLDDESQSSNSGLDTGRDGASWSQPSMSFWPTSLKEVKSARGESPNPEPLDPSMWGTLPKEWVIFSDLHVSRSTLTTCLEVLDRVHAEALKRNAGVIFLGDFWHERGVLRVEPLNSVLDAFSRWRVPLIAIPGNHDQTSLDGSTHALDPIRFALPSARIITEPVVMFGALWMPYRRENQAVREVMRSKVSEGGVKAVFCHVDVIGADMGGGVIADRGLHPDDFPHDLPVYTGHYHRPHEVKGTTGVRHHPIRYVGSPYQTSMAEAGESKLLYVVDTSTWLVCDEVPLTASDGKGGVETIGLRHFKASSINQLKSMMPGWDLRPGDRVQVRVANAATAREELRLLEAQAPAGVRFEVREEAQEAAEARIEQADTLEPLSLFTLYFERHSESTVSAEAREIARSLLEDAVAETPSANAVRRDVVLDEVELKGYGSFGFGRSIKYPLRDRGVVLVVGRNEDEQSADSNGAGKTTLCMAALWALTGSADLRADGKSPSRKDVVHTATEKSSGGRSSASVTLRGSVNGVDFVVKRSVRGGKVEAHVLNLMVGGEDRTKQSIRDTQVELESLLPVAAICDGAFHGQHLVRGLLERTDVDFKKALDNIMPSAVWDAALERARGGKKDAKREMEELSGRIMEKEGEVEPLKEASKLADSKRSEWESKRTVEIETLKSNLQSLEEMAEGGAQEWALLKQGRERELGERESRLRQKQEEEREMWKANEATRRAQEAESRMSRECASSASDQAKAARTSLREWMRGSARLKTAEDKVMRLEREREEWEAGHVQEKEEAMSLVAAGEKSLEAVVADEGKRRAAASALRGEKEALQGVREKAYEKALSHSSSAEMSLAAAQERRDRLLGISGSPQCPLCLQGLDHSAHTNSVADLESEVQMRQSERDAAHGLMMEAAAARDASREESKSAREFEAAEAVSCAAAMAAAERTLAAARAALASVEAGSWGGDGALRDAKESVKDCRAELSSLAAAVKSAVGDAESVPVGEDGKDAHDGDDSLFEAAVKRMEAAAEEARDKAEAIERKSEVDEGKFRNLQSVIDRELSELRSEVDAARDGLASAVKSLERAREVDAQVAEARSRLKAAETAENPHVDAASQSKAALGASIARLEMLKGKREEAMKMLERWGEVDDLFGKRGLQSFVYEVAVLELQARAARYLEGLSDDSLRLELKLEGQVVERRLLTRLSDGTYASRSLQQLSGGQWRRLGLALTLAFSECSLERTSTTCNLIVLDEVMQHLDSEGCARVGKLLEGIVRGGNAVFSTALIILQTSVGEELGDSFDQVDVVVKRQDCSLVLDHDGKEY